MSIERQRRILELLDETLEYPPAERPAFLGEACGDDPELRREVEALLETGDDPAEAETGVLAQPAFSVHAQDAGVGRRLGRYRLVRLLERGGMGAVYLAEREDFEQRVALKVIRRGLDLDEVLVRRFENERQILARLEHPAIARLIDGGATEDGLPYFVMEYVEGEPIDRYCAAHRLSVEERLDLFREVCSAVQYAHQNLVIHRDLKPGNVLITADGQPKLLDFGIAKLLDDSLAARALETVIGQGPMTPRYASPEQIRLEAVTTASDVYSLGVLLYELLTGLDPYRLDTDRSDEIARAICETEPDKPSTAVRRRASASAAAAIVDGRKLQHRLAGDLDSIVLKAMRKEPAARYGSVDRLSEDILRHLKGQPVDARAGTFTYRAGKFVRRHKWAMAVTAAFLLMVLGFSVVSTVLWRQAVRQRRAAQTAFEFSETMLAFAQPDQEKAERLESLRALKDRVAKELTDVPELQIDVAGMLGVIFRNWGAYEDSREMIELSLGVAREHFGEDRPEVVERISNLAVLLYDAEDYAGAEAVFREVLEMGPSVGLSDRELLRIRSNLASVLMFQHEHEEAERIYLDVLRTRMGLAEGPDDEDVATSRRSLAALYFAERRFEEAEPLLLKALETRRHVHGSDHTQVARVLDLLGSVVARQGRQDEAEQLYREALEIRARRLVDGHPDVAKTKKNLAALLARRDPAAAQGLLDPAIETFRRIDPDGWEIAEAESVLGEILTALGRYAEAEPLLEGSYQRLKELRGADDLRAEEALERLERYRAIVESAGQKNDSRADRRPAISGSG